MASAGTITSTARTAAGACLAAGVVLVATAAVFQWSGQATVVGIGIGLALLVLAVMWRSTHETPRWLPTATMMAGIVLVVAPPVLDYNDGNDGDPIAIAYAVHMLTGLGLAALGYWSGKRTGAPRADSASL